jgi:hypothetical protein
MKIVTFDPSTVVESFHPLQQLTATVEIQLMNCIASVLAKFEGEMFYFQSDSSLHLDP